MPTEKERASLREINFCPNSMVMILKQKTKWFKFVACALFFLCLGIGFYLSKGKPLWTDEIYTQTSIIDQVSYKDILLGRFAEGNKCPLFYLIQKGVCDAFDYHFPVEGWDGRWTFVDQTTQIILRIPANVFMSLALVTVFLFFTRCYSIWAGGYALLVCFSSFMVWAYWAEARPYALWMFLSTVQAFLFLYMSQAKDFRPRAWSGLVIVHLLMSLTIVFSAAQIIIVSFLLWVLETISVWRGGPTGSGRIRKLKYLGKYLFLTILPVGMCFYYYRLTQHFYSPIIGDSFSVIRKIVPYYFSGIHSVPWAPEVLTKLVFDAFPKESLLIVIVYAVFLLVYYLERKGRFTRFYQQFAILGGRTILALVGLMLISGFVILAVFGIWWSEQRTGISVSERYFIYLTPVSIIATTIASVGLFRYFQESRWMTINLILGLGGLLAIRLLKTFMDIYALGLF